MTTNTKPRTSTWYEVCVSLGNEVRDVIVYGRLESAKRGVEDAKTGWPQTDVVIFVRQHIRRVGSEEPSTCKTLHSLTYKRTV